MKLGHHVVYIFSEKNRSDIVKIGTCSKGGWERFREGAFMNPRGLDVVAMWLMECAKEANAREREAHKRFERLPDVDGREWFRACRDFAVSAMSLLFGRQPDFQCENLPFSPDNLYSVDRYDELSERGHLYKGRLVQRRIWIHQEIDGEFTKVSQNTWWCEPGSRSTNAKRITFNTRRIVPTACLAVNVDENDPRWKLLVEAANEYTLRSWQDVVDRRGIHELPSGRVGWTREMPDQLAEEFQSLGFTRLTLDVEQPPKGIKSLKYPTR